jgi:hypothetical protein
MDDQYKITDHACRVCFGRVLMRVSIVEPACDDEAECPVHRCSNCGFQVEGPVEMLCACGLRLGSRDAKLRCFRQESPTPEFPSEVAVAELS